MPPPEPTGGAPAPDIGTRGAPRARREAATGSVSRAGGSVAHGQSVGAKGVRVEGGSVAHGQSVGAKGVRFEGADTHGAPRARREAAAPFLVPPSPIPPPISSPPSAPLFLKAAPPQAPYLRLRWHHHARQV
eukprot:355147-Chlamydomonas_euryale.AAC.3